MSFLLAVMVCESDAGEMLNIRIILLENGCYYQIVRMTSEVIAETGPFDTVVAAVKESYCRAKAYTPMVSEG